MREDAAGLSYESAFRIFLISLVYTYRAIFLPNLLRVKRYSFPFFKPSCESLIICQRVGAVHSMSKGPDRSAVRIDDHEFS